MNIEKTQKNIDIYNQKIKDKLQLITLLINDLHFEEFYLYKYYGSGNYHIEKKNSSIKPEIVLIRKKLQELSNEILSSYDTSKLEEEDEI